MLTTTKPLIKQSGIILLLMIPLLVSAEEAKPSTPVDHELLQLRLQLAEQDRKISQLQREMQLLQIEKDRLSYSIELLKQQLQIISWTLNQRVHHNPPTKPDTPFTTEELSALIQPSVPIPKDKPQALN